MTINVGDRPHQITDEVYAKILHHAYSDLILNNAARCARVHEDTLKRWMFIGKEDLQFNRVTFLASFYVQVREKQATKISELLQKIENCSKNWQALAWKLEKCFREDFGADAPEFKELLDQYIKLRDDFIKLKNQLALTQGALKNAEKLDSGSDKPEA
jgi:hypothetical protein